MSTGSNNSYSGPCPEGESVSAVTMKRADGVERETLKTLFIKSDFLQVLSNQDITHALHDRFKIRTVGQANGVEAKNEGRIDSIEDNNAIRGEYQQMASSSCIACQEITLDCQSPAKLTR